MGGSHTLEQFINGVAKDIADPETKMSVWERKRLSDIADASSDDRKEIRQRADLRISALGSGTDFTGFLDHLGIATLDMAYEGETEQGIYHSIYDDFFWYTHFPTTTLSTGGPSPRPWARRSCGWPMPRCCPLTSSISRTPSRNIPAICKSS